MQEKSIYQRYSVLFLVLVILLVFRMSDRLEFLPFFLISVINSVFVIWFLKKYVNSILVYLYFLYGILTLKFCFIFYTLFYTKEQVLSYLKFRLVSVDDLTYATVFIFIFDILTVIFLLLLGIKNVKKKKISYPVLNLNKNAVVIFMIVLSFAAKLYLISIKVWFFYEMNDVDLSQYKFAGIANTIEKLDFIVLLYYTYKFKIKEITKKDYAYFYTVLVFSLFFAFISTSKGKVLILLFPIILMVLYSKNRNRGLAILLACFLFLNTFFQFMLYARTNFDQGFSELVENFDEETSYSGTDNSYSIILENKAIGRMEYQSIVAMVINVYKSSNLHNDYGYEQNIFGLVPRSLWENKPELGLDTNRIGYELGILHASDNYTTIGITPLGVSYYLYGYLGVFLIAFLTAFLIIILLKISDENYWVGFLISIMVGVQLARNGTYLNIVPSLVQTYVVCIIFGILLNTNKSQKR